MKIEVTDEHIKNGICKDANNCPIALAIRETLNLDADEVEVDGIFIEVEGRNFDTTDEIDDFIEDFDSGTPVYPFTFDLPIEEVSTS
jgi:hypothetical protein